MRKEYETPTCEFVKLTLKDVILASDAEGGAGGGVDVTEGGFGDGGFGDGGF